MKASNLETHKVILPETNIAMENPPFWWYFSGKMGIFMGYVSFREGTCLFQKTCFSDFLAQHGQSRGPGIRSPAHKWWLGNTTSIYQNGIPSWWLSHPFEKYQLVKMGSSSPNRGENKKTYLKPPPSIWISIAFSFVWNQNESFLNLII